MSLLRITIVSILISAITSIALFVPFSLLQSTPPSPQQSVVLLSWSLQLEALVQSQAEKVSQAVVSIIISRDIQTYRSDPFGFFHEPSGIVRQKVGGGTGFFFHKDGYILTNKHVVSDGQADYVIITSDGKEWSAKVLATDPTTDLAIIRAFDAKGNPIASPHFLGFIQQAESLKIGTFVLAIWNALSEFQNSVTFGVISGKWRSIEAQESRWNSTQLTGLLQTDAAINPWNSGGPLMNLAGEVVGINTAIAAGWNGLWFSIPLVQKEVDNLLESVIRTGRIDRPILGIQYSMIRWEDAQKWGFPALDGARISSAEKGGVLPWSPAEAAWLEPWDIIIALDKKPLTSTQELRDMLRWKKVGDIVEVEVIKHQSKSRLIRTIQLQSIQWLLQNK
jgi:serine protease Do